MHSYPHCSIYNYWNIENQIKKVFLLFELHSCFQSPWDIFSAGIWWPSMLSCKLELKFSLLSTFVYCSIALITLFVDLVAFSGSLCSVYFLQQFLTVFTWRAFGFFFKENTSLATNSQGIFFLLPNLRNISIILSSNSLPLELYFISLPPPLRFR